MYNKHVVFTCLITGGVVKGVVRVFKYIDWFFAYKQVNKAYYRGFKR